MRIPSNKVCDIERFAHAELETLYPKNEIRTMMQMLFEHYLGWNTAHLLSHRNSTINQSDLLKLNFAIKDLRHGKPIQHIIGKVNFGGATIITTPHTLIPRPETEEIVYNIIYKEKGRNPQYILDICTGSGCIGIALSMGLPMAKVYATDISTAAIAIAKKNSTANGCNISLAVSDIMTGDNPFGVEKYDVIVSNPPYVRDMEKALMSRNVLDYEPHLALFVPDDNPLMFYKSIVAFANKHLAPNGNLYLEINEALGKETIALLEEQGYGAVLHKDFYGKDRMIEAHKLPI